MSKKSAIWALLILVPVPSIGVVVGMYLAPNTGFGKGIFLLSKIWIFVLPIVWRLFVDRKNVSWSMPRHGGLVTGCLTGIGISAIILAVYGIIGRGLIDQKIMREMVARIGLGTPQAFACGAAYWILINSVLEEYVWRWFVVSRLQKIMSAVSAVLVAALAFTLHHIFAMSIYFNWVVVLIASFGIFLGSTIWSWCYVKYRSIWPGYLSHAIVDLTIFGLGYYMLFVG